MELLDVLGKLQILAQLILEHVYECVGRGFRELVVMTSTGMELSCRTNRQRVVRPVWVRGGIREETYRFSALRVWNPI